MKKTLSKTEARKKNEEFFSGIKEKFPKEIKKIKILAMKYNIPLKEKRKLFCKKCFFPYKNPKIRIKNKIKSVRCENCGYVAKWKVKN
jgi:RNase P subunit RPR2